MSTTPLRFVLFLMFSFMVKYAVTVTKEEFEKLNFCNYANNAAKEIREAARNEVIAACQSQSRTYDGGCVELKVAFGEESIEKKIGACWDSNMLTKSKSSDYESCVTKSLTTNKEKYLIWAYLTETGTCINPH